MKKISKRFKEALKSIDSKKYCNFQESINILSKIKNIKFDETIDMSFRLGIDPKQNNHMTRGTIKLPNGSGKNVRVIVFTENKDLAIDSGANFAGLNDLIEKIKEGWLEFDVAISTLSAMKEVRSLARILGPRGLMPNPKSGTVSDDIPNAIKDIKNGLIEYKMDKTGNLSIIIGKKSFNNDKLIENAEFVLKSIIENKPEGLKGQYILNLSISSTMSPSIKLNKDLYKIKTK